MAAWVSGQVGRRAVRFLCMYELECGLYVGAIVWRVLVWCLECMLEEGVGVQ